MAKSSDDVQDDQHSTAKAQDVIATTVQTQLSHISSFDRWLLQWIEDDENHSDVASRVRRRLNRYKEWILGIERASEDFFHDIESWRMSARVRPSSSGGKTITVTGPGSEDPIHISAKDEAEVEHILGDKYLGYMIKVCNALAQAQSTILSLLQATSELNLEESQLSQPPEDTVQTHIRRLKEYNNLKDIGQQLIGLIAENRGVRVGTLYETGEFGVSADD